MIQDVVIRLATAADMPVLLSLEYMNFTSDLINKRQMRYLVTQAKAQVWVVERPVQQKNNNENCGDENPDIKQGKASHSMAPLGYAAVLTPKRQSARLYSIAIDKKYQGQGLGKKLLRYVIVVVQELGYKRLLLEVRASDQVACHLYQSFGFVFDKTILGYYQDGEAALRMCLSFLRD